MAIATGQVSIIDYTDAPSLSAFISSNQPRIQVHNPNDGSYTPNWGSSNVVLTPSLFIAGSQNDIITSAKSVTWYDSDAPTTPITTAGNFVVGTIAQKGTLTIKGNLMTTTAISAKTFIADIVYTDPTSGFDLRIRADITFSKVTNGQTGAAGQDAVFVTAWAPDGNLFKNNSAGTLTAQSDVYKGSTLQTTGVTYEWFVQDSKAADEGAGAGWKKITTTNQASLGVTGAVNASKLTITADAVLNVTSFKSKATFSSKAYYDTVTFIDQTDPIQVTVISSNGEIFKNGQITTKLTAKLFQNAAEIDEAGTAYVYKWYRRDKDGNQDANFGGTGIAFKTGKSIDVTNAMVTQRATFVVEIESK